MLVADETGSVEVIIDDQNTFRKLATGMTVFVRNSCVIMTENHFIQIKVNIWAHIEALMMALTLTKLMSLTSQNKKWKIRECLGFIFVKIVNKAEQALILGMTMVKNAKSVLN